MHFGLWICMVLLYFIHFTSFSMQLHSHSEKLFGQYTTFGWQMEFVCSFICSELEIRLYDWKWRSVPETEFGLVVARFLCFFSIISHWFSWNFNRTIWFVTPFLFLFSLHAQLIIFNPNFKLAFKYTHKHSKDSKNKLENVTFTLNSCFSFRRPKTHKLYRYIPSNKSGASWKDEQRNHLSEKENKQKK